MKTITPQERAFFEFINANNARISGNFQQSQVVYLFPEGKKLTDKQITDSLEFSAFLDGLTKSSRKYGPAFQEYTRQYNLGAESRRQRFF